MALQVFLLIAFFHHLVGLVLAQELGQELALVLAQDQVEE